MSGMSEALAHIDQQAKMGRCDVCGRTKKDHTDPELEACWQERERKDRFYTTFGTCIGKGFIPKIPLPSFDSSDPDCEAPNKECWRDLRKFPQSDALFGFLYGPPGTGKTFAALCVMRRYLDRGRKVAFVQATDFLREMRKFRPSEKMVDAWRTLPLLVIDDLDKPAWKRDDLSALFELMNARHQARLKTLVTTNVAPKELAYVFSGATDGNASLWDATLERMTPFKMFEFTGKSFRQATVDKDA